MATKTELENSLNDPDMLNFLNLIYKSEGASYGYNTLFGNTKFEGLNHHPNIKVEFTDKTGKKDYSTAAGAYQFLYGTWQRIKTTLNLSDFSGHNQDLGAAYLIAEKGALDDVLKGDYKTAINKLGGVWASLPSSQYKSTQNSRSWEDIQKMNEQGGIKKWFMTLPSVGLFSTGVGKAGAIATNPNGVIQGTKEVLDNGGLIDSAGNFLLRGVVIIAAVTLIAIGFYFMFQQEIKSSIIKAV